MDYITSKSNEKLKYAVKLRDNTSFRSDEKRFFIEGARLCRDAFESGIETEMLFVTEQASEKYAEYVDGILKKAKNVCVISNEAAEKLSDTKSPQGVFCVCKMLDKITNIGKIKYNGKYVALENVSNPQNLGAIVRTAEAVGLDGIILSGGCDIFNPKALRASMGSLFRLDIMLTDALSKTVSELRGHGMQTFASVPDVSALNITSLDMQRGTVIAVGNEGNGLSDELIAACGEKVTIPMKGRAESLNAASAASIIMWEMMR